jgi:MerR family mercuric resistance operon transcriptional regulator
MKRMTIGTLARAAGVHVETVRYYQRRGLLAEPKRPPAGVRRYGEEAAARLRFIKRAQDVGFTLDEVAELLRLERGCSDAHNLATARLAAVERRIADLNRVGKTLRELIGRCEAGKSGGCPIIEALAAQPGSEAVYRPL